MAEMRAAQIAILIFSIQIMGSIITSTGLFGGTYYESGMLPPSTGGSASVQTADEQLAASFNVMNAISNVLLWGWIRQYFEPLYSNVTVVHSIVDSLIIGLNGLMTIVMGIAIIQFISNLIQPI